MTDINEIQARISRYGIAHTNRFQVVFSSPPGLKELFGGGMAERLVVQAETAELPGKSFSTREQRIYGPVRKYPYTRTYTSTTDITFRVGGDYRERSLFDVWQGLIMDPSSNMFNWYANYTTDIVIHQLDREDNRIYSVKILEAYPEAIGPIAMSSESNNQYARQSITFAFREWESTDEQPITLQSTTSVQKADNGLLTTVLQKAPFAFFDQLPRITGSGGTIFGSRFNQSF